LAAYKSRRDGQLVGRQFHRLRGCRQIDSRHLEHDSPGFHHGDPALRRSFAFAHTRFSRLLGIGLVREDAYPQLATALDEASDGHARGFDLPVGNPCALESLKSIFAKRQLSPAPSLSTPAPPLLFAAL